MKLYYLRGYIKSIKKWENTEECIMAYRRAYKSLSSIMKFANRFPGERFEIIEARVVKRFKT